MSAISTILTRLRAAIWAIDVRDDIANAIEQCYSDVSNPTLKTEALEAALQTKIDEGEMAALTIGDHTITAAKLAQGVIDNTLATSGAAADAKKTGDEIAAVKADLDAQTGIISLLKDYYIKTSTTPISLTPIASTAGRMCAVIDCTAGDKFVINAYSDSAPARAWCFIDNTNNAISMADANVRVTDLELTAPENAVKLIINDISGGMSYKVGNNLATKADNILSGRTTTNQAADVILNAIRKGLYNNNMNDQLWEAHAAINADKISSLEAGFLSTASDHTFYIGDSVETIRKYIYVNAKMTDGYYVRLCNYALSGSLSGSSNEITVSFCRKTASVTIPASTNSTGIVYDWDFTSSLVDNRYGIEALLFGDAYRDESGLHIFSNGDSARLLDRTFNASNFLLGKTLQVNVTSFVGSDTANNNRFILFDDPYYIYNVSTHKQESPNTGFVFKKGSVGWCFYNKSTWKDGAFTGLSAINSISGKVLNFYTDASSGVMTLYIGGSSKGTPAYPINSEDIFGLYLGSPNYSANNNAAYKATITSVKIFNKKVTS